MWGSAQRLHGVSVPCVRGPDPQPRVPVVPSATHSLNLSGTRGSDQRAPASCDRPLLRCLPRQLTLLVTVFLLATTAIPCWAQTCPPGRWSPTGIAPCTMCASGLYSVAGSTSAGACVACTTGCTSSHGKATCPTAHAWTSEFAGYVAYPLARANHAPSRPTTACPSLLYEPAPRAVRSLLGQAALACQGGTWACNRSCVLVFTLFPFDPAPLPPMRPAVWNDASALEGKHSCLLFSASAGTWAASSAACNAIGTGVHLVTSQVRLNPRSRASLRSIDCRARRGCPCCSHPSLCPIPVLSRLRNRSSVARTSCRFCSRWPVQREYFWGH
jgi:hypothetical protein